MRVDVQAAAGTDTATGTFDGKALPFIRSAQGSFYALLGVDMDTRPGTYPLAVKLWHSGRVSRTLRQDITVRDADFPVQELTLEPAKVFPDSAALKRIDRENKLRNSKWSHWAEEAYWGRRFIPPLDGELKRFGHRRIINGAPRSPHSGVDISADEGEPVICPADGRVILTGDFFFSGKSVYLDHGLGLIGMFFHLSRIDVAEGDTVRQGQVLGAVGSTGRASGPHLHWGIRYRGSRIDPSALLELQLE
ncbi:MAG: M23 family metallopeptidase [Candidatus Glassbacteria bacterium]|nr:M23 family metallopeptidase [Candidatus Glassbacteria bacterium]